MTKRVRLNEVPYEGIEVGEKVMYLTTHGKNTSINYGFYCGTYLFTPVVEYFYRERKWVWNKDRKRYVQSKTGRLALKEYSYTVAESSVLRNLQRCST